MHLPLSQNSDSETKRTHDSVWSTLYLICSHSKSRTRLFFSMTMTMIVATLLVISFTCCVAFEMRDTTLGLNEVVWHSEPSQIFIGSPTILRLANGDILTACDRFGHGFTTQRNVSVFRSKDNGQSWTMQGWAQNQYWSNLFRVNNTVYLLGTDTDHNANIKIAASFDDGATWNVANSAVLVNQTTHGNYQTGATPTTLHNGRLYRALELLQPPFKWGVDYAAVVISADLSSDLLDPRSWTISTPLPFNTEWLPSSWPQLSAPGYLEGNMVVAPNGSLYNILRLNSLPQEGNFAVALRYDLQSNTLVFDRILDFPGGHSKFTIRRHAASGYYLAFTNINTNATYTDQRNILALIASKDMFNWSVITRLLEDDTGFDEVDSVKYTGFHYVDWQFDGQDEQDIIYAIRTAYRGAVSYHNSNRMTFKRLGLFLFIVFFYCILYLAYF
eukprot:m.135204 g.135204  ORF g.135204 m.135204 type:complete len:444 (-) comp13972_c1_seq6:2754-4085(-)